MNLRLKDTVDHLRRDLQLTGADADVYVHLCVAGPAKVSDLADALDVHRNDVYRATERLQQRGLVEMTVERPARFVAVAPAQVFDQEIATRLTAIEDLRKSRVEIMALVEQLHSLAPAAPKGVYKIIQGRAAIYAQRDNMIAKAAREITWATSFLPSLHHADLSGALDLMAKRAREGVAFKILMKTAPESAHKLADLQACPGVEAREFGCDVPVRFFIVDGTELLMWVVNDPSDSIYAAEEAAIYTTAPGFVAAQQQLVEHEWARSLPLPAIPR